MYLILRKLKKIISWSASLITHIFTKYQILIASGSMWQVHECYRETDRRQTDGRQHIANVNVSSRSLKLCIPG